MRKIFRYWRDRDIDVAGEHVHGIRVDRFVGLQPHTASQMEHIKDLPDELFCGNPAHFGFTAVTEPERFQEKFWLEFLPWFYKNNPKGSEDYASMIDGAEICMPALWCEDKTIIAYSKDGYAGKTWELPPDWQGVKKVSVANLTFAGPEPRGEVPAVAGKVTLRVGKGEALKMCVCHGK